VCWSTVVTEKNNWWFFILRGTFLSYSIPKTTMNINTNFFIYISTSGKLYQRISLNCAKEFREFFKLISRYTTRCTTHNHMFYPCSVFICCSQYHVNSDYFSTQYSSTVFSIAASLNELCFSIRERYSLFLIEQQSSLNVAAIESPVASPKHNVFNTLWYYTASHIRRQ